jgi:methyltransferase
VSVTPGIGLAVYLGWLIAERSFELALSFRNTARLEARGAVEHGAAHYPWIVALHVLWPLALVLEFLWAGARPPAWWPLPLLLLVVAQGLRVAAMRALGDRWSTRILVVPGEPPVRSGLYRWIPHPNYAGVVIELMAAPFLFGAWRTAVAASVVNAALLAVRIHAEDRALRRS